MTAHTFQIPVMGTGHSADTPMRVGPFGINSVISLVDDRLLEKLRAYYAPTIDQPYEAITNATDDSRAKRITAYLNTMGEIVSRKIQEIKSQSFFTGCDKDKYFEMLPDFSELKKKYLTLKGLLPGTEKDDLEQELTDSVEPGSIDVNIMVKLDTSNKDRQGNPLGHEFNDALAAFRGFANSVLEASVVLSAGINNSLFNYIADFKEFFVSQTAEPKKKLIIKVSDYRSALIQGKYLAKKGLDVHEFRIESGLNCGGHAFPTNGNLMPAVLKEFKEKRAVLNETLKKAVVKGYEARGESYPEWALDRHPIVTVQGGIGTVGEDRRCREYYGMEMTGWCTPFLAVPEATCVDKTTRNVLIESRPEDLYMSDASPLGILFNNVRESTSNIQTRERYEAGVPGSACRNGLLVFDTEFTDEPICMASKRYQKLKLAQIDSSDMDEAAKTRARNYVAAKECICYNLGNGALIELGIVKKENEVTAVCPGPNIAWFDHEYSLAEMIDLIYGRGGSLAPERPHMFAKEMEMYVQHFEKVVAETKINPAGVARARKFAKNMLADIAITEELSNEEAFADENLASLGTTCRKSTARIEELLGELE